MNTNNRRSLFSVPSYNPSMQDLQKPNSLVKNSSIIFEQINLYLWYECLLIWWSICYNHGSNLTIKLTHSQQPLLHISWKTNCLHWLYEYKHIGQEPLMDYTRAWQWRRLGESHGIDRILEIPGHSARCGSLAIFGHLRWQRSWQVDLKGYQIDFISQVEHDELLLRDSFLLVYMHTADQMLTHHVAMTLWDM